MLAGILSLLIAFYAIILLLLWLLYLGIGLAARLLKL